MKRAAAIIGRTESFVRWSIRHACPLRRLSDANLPYQTFFQLRGLREVSIGRAEQRMVDGVCLHADINQDVDTARGFVVDEILQTFGGNSFVDRKCAGCPANAISNDQRPVWAGCYGWFFSKHSGNDLIESFEAASSPFAVGLDYGLAADSAPTTNDNSQRRVDSAKRVWFRLWQTERWEGLRLKALHGWLTSLPSSIARQHGEFPEFCCAVDASVRQQLVLETELVPAGYSDGIRWKIEPHCANCGCEMLSDARQCGECGQAGFHRRAIVRKVLGLRPYMLLKDILGVERTSSLLEQFHRRGNL